MTHRQIYLFLKFLSREAMLARHILCDGPLLVRPSVLLGAEGPRYAKWCRGTRVATSSSTRPITKDAQQWRGRSIHAAYCYRRAAVAWSGNPCGLLLLGLWSNYRVSNVQALLCFSSTFSVLGSRVFDISIVHYVRSQQ